MNVEEDPFTTIEMLRADLAEVGRELSNTRTDLETGREQLADAERAALQKTAQAARELASRYGCTGTNEADAFSMAFGRFAEELDRAGGRDGE